MNIHEYQAKAVLKEFGLPVSRGVAIFKPEEAAAAADELGGPVWVVKSQIHAGGRGKGTFKGAPEGAKGMPRPSRRLQASMRANSCSSTALIAPSRVSERTKMSMSEPSPPSR